MPRNLQEYQEQVKHPEMEFFEALNIAEIYLDSETSKSMHGVLGSFRQMGTSIWLRLPEISDSQGRHMDSDLREPDWPLFTSSFDAAQVKLRELLHPDELMKWADT